MHHRTHIAVALACLMASACSPYVYKSEINTFSAGVEAVAETYDSGRKEVATALSQKRTQDLIDRRARIGLTPGCANMIGDGALNHFPDCRVAPFGEEALPPPTREQMIVADAAPAFAALKGYAASLAAVTNAADDATLTAASQDLANSLADLATAAAKLKPGVDAQNDAIKAGGAAFGLFATAYLDHRRLEALRSNVPAADQPIKVLAVAMADVLKTIRLQRLALMSQSLRAAAQPFEEAETEQARRKLDYKTAVPELQAKAEAFTKARLADPDAAVAAMVEAHHQLAVAIRDDAKQVKPVIDAAKAFYKAAKQLQEALKPQSPSGQAS